MGDQKFAAAMSAISGVLTDAVSVGKDISTVGHAVSGRSSNAISLPQFVRPLTIESPNFIQESLIEDPTVLNDVIKNLYNVYAGYLLTALQMDQLVVGNRRVRDVLSTITTVGAMEEFVDNRDLVIGLDGSLEAIKSKHSVRIAAIDSHKVYEKEQAREKKLQEEREDRERQLKYKKEDRKTDRKHDLKIKAEDKALKEIEEEGDLAKQHEKDRFNNPSAGPKVNFSTEKSLKEPISSGRQIQVEFAAPAGTGGGTISVTLMVKFNPRIIPNGVVEYILNQDLTQGLYDRYLRYRAGELSFVKDILFGIDRLNRRSEALRKDTDYALQDIFRHKHKNKFKKLVTGSSGMLHGTPRDSHNLANSILMLDESTAKQVTKVSGFSFNNLMDRRRFFNRTYNLFIVLVDNQYSRVTIYTNGIDDSATYSFNELKASASSDKMSIKEIMEYLSKSQMPKF